MDTNGQDTKAEHRGHFCRSLIIDRFASKVIFEIGIDPLGHASLVVVMRITGKRQIERGELLLLLFLQGDVLFELLGVYGVDIDKGPMAESL